MKLLIIILGSLAIGVYRDAVKNKIGLVPDMTEPNNRSAMRWGLLSFLVVPAITYFKHRKELIERAQEHPIESVNVLRNTILLACIMGFLVFFFSLGGGAGTIPFAEQVDANLNTVNEGRDFSTGQVQMIVRGSGAFGDNEISIYAREKGVEAWNEVDTHRVSPDWDTFTAPILFSDPGTYEIKAQTPDGTVIAEDTVRVH